MQNLEKKKNLPDYLFCRPEKFIRLVIEKLEESKEYEERIVKIKEDQYIFKENK